MKPVPSIERLHEVFNYCPETGELRWKISRHKVKAGDLISYQNDQGYILVCLDYRDLRVHRIAWAMMTGNWPVEEIDHINVVKNDNRWVNLRESSRVSQMHNLKKFSTNTSGFKGVSFCKTTKRWQAHIKSHGKNYRLGRFDTPELAHKAYCEAADMMNGEFANHG